MFLTIEPGSKEYIDIQLNELHNLLYSLDLPSDTVNFFMGNALTEFASKNPNAPDPYNVTSFLANPGNPKYKGGKIRIFSQMLGGDGLHVIRFLVAVKKIPQKVKQQVVGSVDHLPLFEKALKLSEMLKNSKKNEILSLTEKSSDVERKQISELKELLENELNSAKEQIAIMASIPDKEKDWRIHPGSKIFLMELFEDMFADAAVVYNFQFMENWENHSFSPHYFDTYIPNAIFPEFVQLIDQILQPLSAEEKRRILEQSHNQFKSCSPLQRRNIIFSKYEKKYWAPNQVPGGLPTSLDYLFQIFPSYEKHFSLFKDFTTEQLNKLMVAHNTNLPFNSGDKLLLRSKSTKSESFHYIHSIKKPDQIMELFGDLKDKKLIDSTTKAADFKKVFLGGPIGQPIKWIGSISELHFFIKCLHNQEKKVEDLKQKHWEVTQNCFVDLEGKQFDREKLKNQKDPISADYIRRLVQNL